MKPMMTLASMLILFSLLPGLNASSFAFENSRTYEFTTAGDVVTSSAVLDTATGVVSLDDFAVVSLDTLSSTYVRDLHVCGDLVFVADNSAGLRIVRMNEDDGGLSEVGSCPTSSYAFGVWAGGRRAYVADYDGGLKIVDVTDVTAPAIVGSCATPGQARDVVLSGSLAYVADGPGGLVVVDASAPDSPVVLGQLDTPGSAMDVAVAGALAFVADYDGGVRIVDISDPTDPTEIATYTTPGRPRGVCMVGRLLFVADNTSGISVLDVSDPYAPTLVGSCDPGGTCYRIASAGHHVYAATSLGLVRVDLSTTSTPTVHSTTTLASPALAVGLNGRYAVAGGGFSLESFRIAHHTRPYVTGEGGSDPGFLAVAGDRAVGGMFGSGIVVYDLSDRTRPTELSTLSISGIRDVVLDGGILFARRSSDVIAFDWAAPGGPTALDTLSVSSLATGTPAALDGGMIYLARSSPTRIEIVDAGDPTNLQLVGSHATTAEAGALWAEGGLLYAAIGSDVVILDVADPAAVTQVAQSSFSYDISAVCRSGTHLLVLAGDPGIIYQRDVSDLSSPSPDGDYGSSSTIFEMLLEDREIYTSSVTTLRHMQPVEGSLTTCSRTEPIQGTLLGCQGDDVFLERDGLAVLSTLNRDFDVAANTVLLAPPTFDDALEVASLRITDVAGEGRHVWTFSNNNGTTELEPGVWYSEPQIADPFFQVFLELYPDPSQPDVRPTCDRATLEWILIRPVIDAITDVPGDQGGQVSLTFTAAHGDPGPLYTGEERVTSYALFRRFGDAGKAGAPLPFSDAAKDYPPGDWHFVTELPAMTETTYSIVVPTLVDSTGGDDGDSVFFVRALTGEAGLFYDSPPDSGRSVDNLAPNVPAEFAVAYSAAGNDLSWQESEAEDFRYFRVYRSESNESKADPATPIHVTTGTAWTDPAGDFGHVYSLTAVDFAGNESELAWPARLTGTGAAPRPVVLMPNYPNPFNPRTTLAFRLGAPTSATLGIYDMSGREVARLLDDAALEAGEHRVAWDGCDGAGRTVSAGTYVMRLEAQGAVRSRRITLLK